MALKENIETREFDVAEFLDNEETINAYLAESLASGDQAEFLEALSDVARARGMTQLANETGIARESLYKALNGTTKPRFETILRILNALNIQLTTQYKQATV
ncbi:addiction module antidote protein [Lonepinella sp. BR2474]|uniref:addiction module antidote protein n=1 Tax=Lonepinella sp. BR2474 TaxID=3434548 RepID=UPI003F6DD04B